MPEMSTPNSVGESPNDYAVIQGSVAPATPTIGRIVRYVLPSGKERAAIVVNQFANYDPMMVNLGVFTDGTNDSGDFPECTPPSPYDAATGAWVGYGTFTPPGTVWRTSVHYSETPKPYTWHWPTTLVG